jgi:hypothetical protein
VRGGVEMHSTTKLALCFLLLAVPCAAQLMSTGTITGIVIDQAQGSVPGAAIEITNAETHNKVQTVSNSNGSFTTVGLPAGHYEVTVSGKGFASYTETNIYLGPAATYSISALLKPAAVSTAVTVQATVERVQADTAEIASKVSQEQVENLPLNGRSYQGLAALMPGVTNMQAGTALGTGGYITQNSMNVNGTGQTATLYTVDGIWNMQTSNMQETTITPNPDSIEEVKVLQNNYSAEYNIMGAAAVIVQTRSGTEVFHGGAWEFLRNTALDARNFYSVNVPAEQGNIFGWHLGGPVYIPHVYSKEHKTFFYVNQQWVRQNQPMVANGAAVPAAMRGMGTPGGNAVFPATGPYASTVKDPLNGQAFAANTIPASRLNPNSLAFLNALEPLPNNQTNAFNNYLNPDPAKNAQFNQEYKVDQNLSSKYRLMGEFLHEGQAYTYPRGQRLGTVFPNNYDVFSTHNSLAQLQLTQILSPSATNQVSVAMNRFIFYHDIDGISQLSQIPGYNQQLPFTGGYLQNYLPAVTFSGGWSSMGTQSSIILPRFSELEKMFTDNASWLRGKHFLQAGGTLLWGTHREYSNSGPSTTGAFNFNGTSTGNPIGDFLLGNAATFGQSSTQIRKHIHYPLDTFYVQDRWQVARRLTLSLGVRFFYMPKPHEQPGGEVVFNPANYNPANVPVVATGGGITPTPTYDPANGLIYNGINGVPSNLTNAHNYYLSPVFGFAWDPFGDGKTALRGGYSINYTKSAANSDCAVSCISAPAIQSVSLLNVNFPSPTGGRPAAPTAFVVYSEDLPNMRAADVQTYSLSLQHQFGSSWFVSIAGAGDIARHLPQMLNSNQPGPVPGFNFNPLLNTGNYANAYFAPYQGYSTINYYTSGAYANWNALELNLRHPVGHNLFLSASYTWSHGLSTLSGQQFGITGSTPQNSNNPKADYGNTTLNMAQVFTTSMIYTLPLMEHSSGWKRAVLGGWKFAEITAIQSGPSFSPGLSVSRAGLATRPDLIAPVTEQKTLQQWFSTTSFTQAAPGFFGNAGRGVLTGPGLINFDVAAYKDFRFSERWKAQLRGEFFNALNHTNFNSPNANFGAGNFGQITSSKDPRIGEVALKISF